MANFGIGGEFGLKNPVFLVREKVGDSLCKRGMFNKSEHEKLLHCMGNCASGNSRVGVGPKKSTVRI